MAEDEERQIESLLPYAEWGEEAMRQVVASAVTYAAKHGLPGEHHFYITFRTDFPGVAIPPRLRAQYPEVMTIVLQHQYWNLKFDEQTRAINVGLSFGGIETMLVIPLAAVTAFADPHVRFGLQFSSPGAPSDEPQADSEPEAEPEAELEAPAAEAEPEAPAEVVSLDAFRRRSPPKS